MECISPFRVRDRLLLLSKHIKDLRAGLTSMEDFWTVSNARDCFVLLSTQFSVFVRDHVGRKVVVEERL